MGDSSLGDPREMAVWRCLREVTLLLTLIREVIGMGMGMRGVGRSRDEVDFVNL